MGKDKGRPLAGSRSGVQGLGEADVLGGFLGLFLGLLAALDEAHG